MMGAYETVNPATVDANESTLLADPGGALPSVKCRPPTPSNTIYTTKTGNHATRSYQCTIRYPINEIWHSFSTHPTLVVALASRDIKLFSNVKRC